MCWTFAFGKAVEQGALEQLSTHVWYVQLAVIPTCLLPLTLQIKPAKHDTFFLLIHNQSASTLSSRDEDVSIIIIIIILYHFVIQFRDWKVLFERSLELSLTLITDLV